MSKADVSAASLTLKEFCVNPITVTALIYNVQISEPLFIVHSFSHSPLSSTMLTIAWLPMLISTLMPLLSTSDRLT